MEPFHEYMPEYKQQLARGALPRAYRGLMEYLMSLRAHFQSGYPDHFVSGSLYQGYMDMSYFSFTPPSLKQRSLKVAVVFLHEACSFEVWLGGANKQVQSRYWKFFHESGWDRYRLVPTTAGADSILEHTLVADPDFSRPADLTTRLETGTLEFIREIEEFLSDHPQ